MAFHSVPVANAGKKARQGRSPAERQFDPGDYSRRAIALAAQQAAAFRAATARIREPRDRPKSAEATD